MEREISQTQKLNHRLSEVKMMLMQKKKIEILANEHYLDDGFCNL